MIRRLQRRMTLLVIAVLILVTGGIVFAINFTNYQSIARQAETTLDALAANSGSRPVRGTKDTRPDRPEPPELSGRPGRYAFNGEALASMANFYTVALDDSGSVVSWQSDRTDLYTDEQIAGLAADAWQSGKASGRIGTDFYRLVEKEDGSFRLIVLDARLDMLAAQRVLRTTSLVAAAACLLLGIGAWLLIRRMVKPVEAAFERQKRFIWDASHELKTPLAVISANADVLADEAGESEPLRFIRSEVRRTDQLVQHLLSLARMDQGTIKADLKEIDLSEAVLTVALPFESTVFEAGKTFEIDVPEHQTGLADTAMLQQLTVILLSNALKYSDEHGLIRLSLHPKKNGRGHVLTVFNTGAGIAPEDLEHVFDRFYRTDASRNSETGGEGLGLSIAKGIVELHRGTIRAESVPGENATFIVELN